MNEKTEVREGEWQAPESTSWQGLSGSKAETTHGSLWVRSGHGHVWFGPQCILFNI